jgi:hypothetical protein
MRRLAILLFLLATALSAEAREIGVRIIYRTPAGPPAALPWALHPVLSAPTPLLAVSDRDTTDGGTTAGFFARLADLGFACLAFGPPRRRIRRAEVVCARGEDGEDWFGYAGGWSAGGGVFVVDRIRTGRGGSAGLLAGAQVGAHVRGVVGGAEPPERVMAVRDTPVRRVVAPYDRRSSGAGRHRRRGRALKRVNRNPEAKP